MALLSADELELYFGQRRILEGASLRVEPRDRLGVVGLNGTGKSTLLKILAGQLSPDGGAVRRSRGVRVGYLAQEHGEAEPRQLLDSLMVRAPGRPELEARLAETEAALDAASDAEAQLELSERLVELHEALSNLEERFGRHQAERILSGLGFSEEQFDTPVAALSGGWRMRAALAALLYAQPEVLLLDEPTNHLDMPSVTWLSGFLSGLKQAVVLTCHDRGFLNRHVRRVAAFEPDGLKLFSGDYDAYLKQREQDLLQLERRAEREAQQRKQLEGFVERFAAKASKARQAQSRVKQIEKLEARMVEPIRVRRAISLSFQPTGRTGDPVISVEGLSFGYDDKPLFSGLELRLRRGQRVALMGVNGAGKTTLLKLIAGELAPSAGQIQLGKHVKPAYFAQHHADQLNSEESVLEAVWRAAPELSQTAVRNLCGAFLFSGDDVDKPVGVLSGGEKARVALSQLLAAPGNLLLLDEPTNHLDTEAADKLTASLESYDGALLFVSHNQDFAERLANVVWDVRDGRVRVEEGSVREYLDRLEREQAERGLSEAPSPDRSAPPSDKAARMAARQADKQAKTEARRARRRWEAEIEAAEAAVAKLEAEIEALEAALADPATHADPAKAKRLSTRYPAAQAELEVQMERWVQAEAELEALPEL